MTEQRLRPDFTDEQIQTCLKIDALSQDAERNYNAIRTELRETQKSNPFEDWSTKWEPCFTYLRQLEDAAESIEGICDGRWKYVTEVESYESFINKAELLIRTKCTPVLTHLASINLSEGSSYGLSSVNFYYKRTARLCKALKIVLSNKDTKLPPLKNKDRDSEVTSNRTELSQLIEIDKFSKKDRQILKNLNLVQERKSKDLYTLILDTEDEDIDALPSKESKKIKDRFRKRVERLNEKLIPIICIDREGESIFWKRLQ